MNHAALRRHGPRGVLWTPIHGTKTFARLRALWHVGANVWLVAQVWAADDCLVNPFNLVSRDLRRVHTRMPWVRVRKVHVLLAVVHVITPMPGQVWNERAYSEDNGDDSIMGRSIRGVKFAQAR